MNFFLEQTKWLIIIEIIYLLFVILVCIRIIWDTRSTTKTLAYLMLVIFFPIIGAIFYFSFGINYRKRKTYGKKLKYDEKLQSDYQNLIEKLRKEVLSINNKLLEDNVGLIRLLSNEKTGHNLVLPNSVVEVLDNGENLYPIMLDELKKAEKFIHLEYYIYENDVIGNQIKDILIEKAKQGVEVRFIYDDFGSSSIRKNIARELRKNEIEAYPFNKIKLIFLANRINYRNHRKIVIIDGITSFVGGINVCDKYINQPKNEKFWRDTHLMIKGLTSLSLQRIFLSDWNFCSNQDIIANTKYFPVQEIKIQNPIYVQIASSGPDCDVPSILYTINKAISSAKKEILLTTPYFIPEQSLKEAMVVAALSGIDVKLLVPNKGDSKIVNSAAQSYYQELLEAGVKIYRYKKGFVHAKTFVVDQKIASVGTANLDMRSFDLNFEVITLIYNENVAQKTAESFYNDLKESEEILLENWEKRSTRIKLFERIMRLFSPFM